MQPESVCIHYYCIIAIKAQSAHAPLYGPVLADVAQTIAPIIWESRRKWEKWSHTLAQIKQLSFYSAPYTNGLSLRGIQNNLCGVTEILCAFDCFILAIR